MDGGSSIRLTSCLLTWADVVCIVLQWFSVHVLENDRSYLVLSPLSSGGAERIGPIKCGVDTAPPMKPLSESGQTATTADSDGDIIAF